MADSSTLKNVKKRALVIGQPIGHSLSPWMHRYWLCQNGIEESDYDSLEVSPADLKVTLDSLWHDESVAGMNVTIPHKEAVANLCAFVTPRAERTLSVNTLIRHEKGWLGDSSDGSGFVASLRSSTGLESFEHVVMLGAGGAACSIGDALLAEGVVQSRLSIVNRSLERGVALCERLKRYWSHVDIVAKEKDSWDNLIQQASLLIQTTSMGLMGGPRFDYSLKSLKEGSVVADIVYRPLETTCLLEARLLGHSTVDGLGMLMYQGAVGFQAWFGVQPKVDEGLRSILLEAMLKNDE